VRYGIPRKGDVEDALAPGEAGLEECGDALEDGAVVTVVGYRGRGVAEGLFGLRLGGGGGVLGRGREESGREWGRLWGRGGSWFVRFRFRSVGLGRERVGSVP
jgi:hypothetical protein